MYKLCDQMAILHVREAPEGMHSPIARNLRSQWEVYTCKSNRYLAKDLQEKLICAKNSIDLAWLTELKV